MRVKPRTNRTSTNRSTGFHRGIQYSQYDDPTGVIAKVPSGPNPIEGRKEGRKLFAFINGIRTILLVTSFNDLFRLLCYHGITSRGFLSTIFFIYFAIRFSKIFFFLNLFGQISIFEDSRRDEIPSIEIFLNLKNFLS